MKISKKKFGTLQCQIARQVYMIEVLDQEMSNREQRYAKNIARYVKFLRWAYGLIKFQKSRIEQLKRELATAKEMRRRSEQTIKNMEDILYPGGKK